MISKTKLKQRIKRKTNSHLVDTLNLARENPKWNKLGQIISGSTRKIPSINLNKLDGVMKDGDTVVFPGKILGVGNLSKRGKVCALSFSNSARAKLEKNKCPMILIKDEIKSNPKAEGVVLL